MAGRFGVSGCAGMHTKAQDHPVQYPMAVNVAWTGASVLGETLLQKQPSWWNCLGVTTGSFLVIFRWHL